MSLKNQVGNVYSVGLRSVGAYQVSGRPWVTGSTILTGTSYFTNADGSAAPNGEFRVDFPYVTKSVFINNTTGSNSMLIHFVSSSSDGGVVTTAQHHYLELQNGQNITLDVKCKEIYISCGPLGAAGNQTFELLAELTNIPPSSMYSLTGSGMTG